MSLLAAFKPPSTRFRASLRRRLSSAPGANPLTSVTTAEASGTSHELTNLTRTEEEPEDAADHASITPSKHTPRPLAVLKSSVASGGPLRPFRLLRLDLVHLKQRWVSDWTTFNQLVFASSVYVFFTNLLPGITFASDLYVLTGQQWGTIEVVLSTGLCGVVFSL
jgi:hypothetical protein